MRLDAWREIRALRAAPKGQASEEFRINNFRGALAQAEELAEAAEAAGYASNALPLFYAVEQCGRAILELKWPGDIESLDGHGLSYALAPDPHLPEKKDQNVLHGILKHGGQSGAFQAVTEATGSPKLAGGVTLGAVWAANPDLRGVPIPSRYGRWLRPLTHEIGIRQPPFGMDGRPGNPDTALQATPGAVYAPLPIAGDTVRAVKQVLKKYSSLAGAGIFVEGKRGPVGEDSDLVDRGHHGDGRAFIQVGRPAPESMTFSEFWAAENELYTVVEVDEVAGRDQGRLQWIGHALPDLGGQPAPQPLMLWWALLLGLSALVRYHPGIWTATINADESTLAVPVQQVIDIAAERVPVRLAEALKKGSRRRA